MKMIAGMGLCLAVALLSPAGADGLVITEFMASNRATLADEDGQSSDWIEIYNEGEEPVNLEGWSLTEDVEGRDRWWLPAMALEPGAFLLVFASGKDRADPGSELHADFRLSASGQYLGLWTPASWPASEFWSRYPRQIADVSYGRRMDLRTRALVPEGAEARYLVPRNGDLGLTWTEVDFDDGAWAAGPTGIGFDQKSEPTFADLIRTDVGDVMRSVNASIYIRIPFLLDAEDLDGLFELKLKFADGFIAFINGTEVARENMSGTTIRYNRRARASRREEDARVFAAYPLAGLGDILRAGENVLAIQAMNNARTDDDFFVLPVLEALEVLAVSPDVREYYARPTPGWPNAEGLPGIAEDPLFSSPSGAYVDPFELSLTGPSGGEIRYTLDSSEPTGNSDIYTEPLLVETTTFVKARVFQDGLLPSPIVSGHYVFIRSDLASFSSNLPIVIVNTFGRPIPGTNTIGPGVPMHIHIVDRGEDGRAHMTGRPNFSGNGAIKVRGSSTTSRPKKSYRFEIEDERGDDRAVEILDFPKESDFILYGAYNFDQALMRNALIYELSNQVGRYAARSRFCEVWVNIGRVPVSSSHYMGVYSIMETLKRDENRIDIARLLPEDEEEPDVTGGYILKIDRPDPGEVGFSAGGQTLRWVEPKEREVTARQRSWLTNWLNRMSAAVRTRDPRKYEAYIDIDSWIDHHILNVFPKNVDAFRLSGYMFKDREGRLQLGPIWDYDRSMGSTDGRDRDPRSWPNTGGDGGTRYFAFGWYGPLFNSRPPTGDDEWAVRYRARWRELRGGPLSTENIHAVIDRMAEEIGEAADRNYQKWRQGNFPAAVRHLKDWLATRADWIDGQFIKPPRLTPPGGQVEEGLAVGISAPDGEIYYTVNGPDPRAGNAAPAPEAALYAGPIRIAGNTRIRTRARVVDRVWSELVTATYIVEPVPLVVTEIMYNPGAPPPGSPHTRSRFEYVEIQNIGDRELELGEAAFTRGITFSFADGAVRSLAPGAYALVVRDRDALLWLHPDLADRIAGEYTGSLSDRGERIEFVGPVGEAIHSFTYRDRWYPETDGGGYSLVIRDPWGPRESWSDEAGWRASGAAGGSPGAEDVEPGMQLPGDLNQDGALNISDALGLLYHLFRGAPDLPCSTDEGNRLLLDLNLDGRVDLGDAVHTLTYLFLQGPPPLPGLECIPIHGCPDACGAASP